MALRICYDVSAHLVLTDPEWAKKARLMREAGVDRLWLFGYFYGTWESDPEEIAKAKKCLEEEGFEVQAISLPFGHGGNALRPDDPTVNLTNGRGWRMMIGRDGMALENTTCPEETCIADTRDSLLTLRQIGITKLFWDDDLRLAHWGRETQGCFCPDCQKRFAEKYGPFRVADIDVDPDLTAAWHDFQSEHVVSFMEAVAVPGITQGAMLMHNGDQRHGIDIARMKARIPGIFFRVGEGHFDDASFTHPLGKPALTRSIGTQMAAIGEGYEIFSESTVFPANALSPENWIEKMRIEIAMGLKNLYLMSGTWFIEEPYWLALRDTLPELREREAMGKTMGSAGDPIWHL